VNGVFPVLAAGGTFAVTALAGLLAGVWLEHATGHAAWVAGGLFAGLALGAYSAVRLLQRSM
jgi:hypothetical protein